MTEDKEQAAPTGADGVAQTFATRLRLLCKNVFFTMIILTAFFAASERVLALIGVRPLLLTEDPLVGFAEHIPQFVEARQADGSVILKTANNKRRLFNIQTFPKNKAGNSYRIFCMGGSTTYGRPYYDGVSFCGWLRAFLRAADPMRNWEVINAGGISFASYRVAKLMDELKPYAPDLFIVYSGQNEFLEQRSYGTLMNLPSWVLHADAVFGSTRTYAAMRNVLDALRPDSIQQARKRAKLSGEVDEILNHTMGPISYHRDDTLKRQIMTHYRLNLSRMVPIARSVNADIIFVQPAINLKDMSPFKSEHKAGLNEEALMQWQALVQQATALHEAGRMGEALALYRRALPIDDRYAELHFRIGQVLFDLGEYRGAEQAFWRAVDEDIAPLRILSPMQRIVKDVASRHNVPLIDFPRILQKAYFAQYDHAVLGKEFFVDHVHTNMEGYRLLGLALLDQLVKQGIATPVASWGEARMERVKQEAIAGLDPREEGWALKNLGKVLDWAGKFDEAHNAVLRALEILGPDPVIFFRLANTLSRQGELDEALHYLRQVVPIDPNRADLHQEIGSLLAQQGKTNEAIEHYQWELQHHPNNHRAHTGLAIQLAKQDDSRTAIHHFSEALRLKPDDEVVKKHLQQLRARRHRVGAAVGLPR